MLLAVDIGNTNITLGAYEGEILTFTSRLETNTRMTSDQYACQIKDVLSLHGRSLSDIEDCIISSVVPNVQTAFCNALFTACEVVPMTVGPGIKTGLNIKIDNPAQLGADFVAGAVGAIAEYTLPCVVIDMGTATTFGVIDSNGSFLGGSICAGVRLTLKALTENTAQLPSIEIAAPPTAIGTNTADCMKSGLVIGTAAMIDGLIMRIERELGEKPTVVATGGLASKIVKHCETEIIFNDNLLLDGLRIIYEKNK